MLIEGEDYTVIDDYFDSEYFREMKQVIMSETHDRSLMPWYFTGQLNHNHTDKDTEFYFNHVIYLGEPSSSLYDLFRPLWRLFDIKSLIRIKANCYPSKENLVTHAPHADFPYKHKGAIIYINSCDGYTILEDGTKIESIENRVLFFDPSKNHSSTNCTNEKARYNINVNYF